MKYPYLVIVNSPWRAQEHFANAQHQQLAVTARVGRSLRVSIKNRRFNNRCSIVSIRNKGVCVCVQCQCVVVLTS